MELRINSVFRGASDFFTLDPNLATALRITYAGGTSAAQAQPERGSPRKKKSSVARQGKNEPFPFACLCARICGAIFDVVIAIARDRSRVADAL